MASASLGAQPFKDSVAVGDMRGLHLFKFGQKLERGGYIMAIERQARDELTLSLEMLFAPGYVLLDQL